MEAAGIDPDGESLSELDELMMPECLGGEEIGKVFPGVGFRGQATAKLAGELTAQGAEKFDAIAVYEFPVVREDDRGVPEASLEENDGFRRAIRGQFKERPGRDDLELADPMPERSARSGAGDERPGGGAEQCRGGGAQNTAGLPGTTAGIVQSIGDHFAAERRGKGSEIGGVEAPFQIDVSVLSERERKLIATVDGIDRNAAQRLAGGFDVEHDPSAEGVLGFRAGRRLEMKIESAFIGQQHQSGMQVGVVIKILVDPQVAGNAHR